MTEAVRLQVAEYHTLVAEVVGSYDYINRLRSDYAMAKWRAGKPFGGMLMQRADLPRYFDVPVGATIPCRECGADLEDGDHALNCSHHNSFYEAPIREMEPEDVTR